jgi:hypothetical protein
MNEHFSVEHAEAHYNGEESEMNPKHEWEDELALTNDVDEVIEHENASYPIQGNMPNGDSFHFDIPKMRLFEITSSDSPSTFIGCSESILNNVEVIKTESEYIIKVTLKELEPMSNPTPGIYIAAQEFPKELIF